MHISRATVSRHLANIYLKLGVSNRVAAATYAQQYRLAPQPLPLAPAVGGRRSAVRG